MIESTIGGLTFSIDPTNPRGIGELQGWYSAPPKRAIAEDRPNGDGAFDRARDFRGSRVITQRGLMSDVSLESAVTGTWRTFAGLQSAGTPSLFSVTDPAGTLGCQVSVVVADITPLVNGDAEYVLQMLARDPIKYGPTVEYPTGLPSAGGGLEFPLFDPAGTLSFGSNGNLGRVELSNSGTADVSPTFTVSGELTAGFYIQELASGSILRYDRVVPAGSTVSLNSRTGEVLVDGLSDGSTYLTVAQWFNVPAGQSLTVQFNAISGSSGSPTMTAAVASGWW